MHKSPGIATPPPGPEAVPTGLTARLLPPEEWETRLKGTALEGRPLNPQYAIVPVVERDGEVVACLAVLTLVHAENLWEAPEVRGNPGVSRALLACMVEQLVKAGVPEVQSQSESPEMDAIFERVGGTRIPGHAYVIPVGDLKETL